MYTLPIPFLRSPMNKHLGQFYLLVIENSAMRSWHADIFLTYLFNSVFVLSLKDYT